jgi:hypothetical protein
MTLWQWLILFVVCAGFGAAWHAAGEVDKWQ